MFHLLISSLLFLGKPDSPDATMIQSIGFMSYFLVINSPTLTLASSILQNNLSQQKSVSAEPHSDATRLPIGAQPAHYFLLLLHINNKINVSPFKKSHHLSFDYFLSAWAQSRCSSHRSFNSIHPTHSKQKIYFSPVHSQHRLLPVFVASNLSSVTEEPQEQSPDVDFSL